MFKLIPITAMMLCLSLLLGFQATQVQAQTDCADWQAHEVGKLHSSQMLNLCELMGKRPVLIVNTASHCGFTGQFKGLEALYQRYEKQGLVVVGVPSDSFNQEADNAAETAEVCYKNYGVSFPMTQVLPVRGEEAHAMFKHLSTQQQAPQWNFNKYLVDQKGHVVAHFPSHVTPQDARLRNAIEKLL